MIPDFPKVDFSQIKGMRVLKRSLVIVGHKTSLSAEEPFWSALRKLAKQQGLTMSELALKIDEGRGTKSNFSSACRLYVLASYKALAEKQAKEIERKDQQIDELKRKLRKNIAIATGTDTDDTAAINT